MRIRFKEIRPGINQLMITTVAGIFINVVLSFLVEQFELPLYIDTIGTIGVTILGGVFPGIVSAVATNIICTLFNSDALFFTFINVVVALCVEWYVRNKNLKKLSNVISLVFTIAVITGVLSGIIQLILFGKPQLSAISDATEAIGYMTGLPKPLIFIVLNIFIGLADKGISIGVTLLLIRLIPQNISTIIRNSVWKQRPLSPDEIKPVKDLEIESSHNIRKRITFMTAMFSLLLTLIMGWVILKLHFDAEKETEKERTVNAAALTKDLLSDDIIEYLTHGESEKSYSDIKEKLKKIKETTVAVSSIYFIQFRDDGIYIVFDVEDEGIEEKGIGDKLDYTEEMMPYMNSLTTGDEIGPIEGGSILDYNILSFAPLRTEDGFCLGYVVAKTNFGYYHINSGIFLIKVLIILAGFFVLIVACVMWIVGFYTVYPINSIVYSLYRFINARDDQEKLDYHVKQLRKLDIRTDDEIEKLYHTICNITSGMAEQMRDIRHYMDTTTKMQNGLIITMADMVENRDSDTGAHIQKTAAYVRIIMNGLKRKGYYPEKLTEQYMNAVEMSAPLHDVGKINIPDSVLNKPGKLTEEEYAVMKTHTTAGKQILERAISTVKGENYLKEARNMAAYHHERWDGKGYPEGLHGEVIPLSARIMAIADVFDALASPRVYKPAFPFEKALEIIQDGSGTQFDPKCVEAFMDSLPEVKIVLQKYQNM